MYSILNGAKYFVEDGSQNYLVFQPPSMSKSSLVTFLHGNLKECQNKVSRLELNQIIVLTQN